MADYFTLSRKYNYIFDYDNKWIGLLHFAMHKCSSLMQEVAALTVDWSNKNSHATDGVPHLC